MKNNTSLLHHKELFTSLYEIASEVDTKKYIKNIIEDIDHQSANTALSAEYIKLYCNFYERLFIITQNTIDIS